MTTSETIKICDSMDGLISSMQGRKSQLKEQILSLPQHSGLRILLLSHIDQIGMALKEIEASTTFIANQVHRHQNTSAA